MAKDILVPFSYTKDGIYYFERRVPRDLRKHYSAAKIAYSLRTRSASVAASRATRAAQRLDEYWYHLRLKETKLPGMHLLRLQQCAPDDPKFTHPTLNNSASVSLSEAVAIYLRLKGQNRPVTFRRAAERACGYVIDVCGDKDLLAYSKADATRFRDTLVERKLTGSSITRIFGTIRSVFNFAASEVGVSVNNPFTGVYYDRRSGVQERAPLPVDVIKAVQMECVRIDDDLRWLVALVSDTGLRLAEAAGLRRDDIVLDADIPHVVVKEHPWRRLGDMTKSTWGQMASRIGARFSLCDLYRSQKRGVDDQTRAPVFLRLKISSLEGLSFSSKLKGYALSRLRRELAARSYAPALEKRWATGNE